METRVETRVAATVSEIHHYPSRPEGFAEPLFLTRESAEEIMEHFLEAPWLGRASGLVRVAGQAPGGAGRAFGEARAEPVEVRQRPDGKVELFRGCGPGREPAGSRKKSRRRRPVRPVKLVLAVIEGWREVRDWWREGGGTDRHVYRLLLSDGSVVDVAREPGRRSGRPGGRGPCGCGPCRCGPRDRDSWTLVGVVD